MAVVYSKYDKMKPANRFHCIRCGKLISTIVAEIYCSDCREKVKEQVARDDGELSQNPCE